MKQFLLFTALLLCSMHLFAQNDVELNLNFLYDGNPFIIDQEYSQANGNPISFERCEFYISQISIQHDGGMETNIEDTWILADPEQNSYALGQFDIEQVESITFSIGVEQPINNADPTLWPAGHPLAPQNPSMHWGWTSGYRFIAIEGLAGNTPLSQVWEVHALGNNQYYSQTISTGSITNGDVISVGLNVNVDEFLVGLNPDGGFIAHGESGQQVSNVIQNARTTVFTASDGTVGISNSSGIKVECFPNPASDYLRVSNAPNQTVDFIGSNGSLNKALLQDGRINLNTLSNGVYILSIMNDAGISSQHRILISK